MEPASKPGWSSSPAGPIVTFTACASLSNLKMKMHHKHIALLSVIWVVIYNVNLTHVPNEQ